MKWFNLQQRKYLANYCFAASLAAAVGLIFQRQDVTTGFVIVGGLSSLALISLGVYFKRFDV